MKQFFQKELSSLIVRADSLVSDANNLLFNLELDLPKDIQTMISQSTSEFYNKLMEIVVKIQISQFDQNYIASPILEAPQTFLQCDARIDPFVSPDILFSTQLLQNKIPEMRPPFNFESQLLYPQKNKPTALAFNIYFETNEHLINEESRPFIYTVDRHNRNSFTQVTADQLEKSPTFEFVQNDILLDAPPGLTNLSEDRQYNSSVIHNDVLALKDSNPQLFRFLSSTPPQIRRFQLQDTIPKNSPQSTFGDNYEENSIHTFEQDEIEDFIDFRTTYQKLEPSDIGSRGEDFSTTASQVSFNRNGVDVAGKLALNQKLEEMKQRKEQQEKQVMEKFTSKYNKIFEYSKRVNLERDKQKLIQSQQFRLKLQHADELKQKQQLQRIQQATHSLLKIEEIKRKKLEQKQQLLNRIQQQQEENEQRRKLYLLERKQKLQSLNSTNSVEMKIQWSTNSTSQQSAIQIIQQFLSTLTTEVKIYQNISHIISSPSLFQHEIVKVNEMLLKEQLKGHDLIVILQFSLMLLFYQNDLSTYDENTYECFITSGFTNNDSLKLHTTIPGILSESILLHNVFIILQLLSIQNSTKPSVSMIIDSTKMLDDIVTYDSQDLILDYVTDKSLLQISKPLLNNFFEVLLLKFDLPYLPNEKYLQKVKAQSCNLQIFPNNNKSGLEYLYFYDSTTSLQLTIKILQVIIQKNQIEFKQGYYQELFLMLINQIAQIVLSPQSYTKDTFVHTSQNVNSVQDSLVMYQDLASLLCDMLVLANIIMEHFPINLKLYDENDVTILQQELKEIILYSLGPKIYNFSDQSSLINFVLPYFIFLPCCYQSQHIINLKQPFKLNEIKMKTIFPSEAGNIRNYDLLGEFQPPNEVIQIVNYGFVQALQFTSQILRQDLINAQQLKYFIDQFVQTLNIEIFIDKPSTAYLEEIYAITSVHKQNKLIV